MNYYGAQEGPYQEQAKKAYSELRMNVVNNVFKVSFGRSILYHKAYVFRNTNVLDMFGSSMMP